MRTAAAVIVSNEMIARDIYRMVLKTDLGQETACGQFVQVAVPGYFLRRPISVHRASEDELSLIYRIAGDGTRTMSTLKAGETVDLFGPLGSGFPLLDEDVTLIGGGVGVPPLVETAFRYIQAGYNVTAVLGFSDKDVMICRDELEALGCQVIIATMDGSAGYKGTVLDAIEQAELTVKTVLACGPLPMLKAVAARYDGYISLEERMACGIGACMGCVIRTPDGDSRRICKDGPVFRIGEVEL